MLQITMLPEQTSTKRPPFEWFLRQMFTNIMFPQSEGVGHTQDEKNNIAFNFYFIIKIIYSNVTTLIISLENYVLLHSVFNTIFINHGKTIMQQKI